MIKIVRAPQTFIMRFAGDIAIKPMSLSSARGGGNYSAAAGVVDIADSFGAMRDKAPRFDQLSAGAMQNQSAEKRAAMDAESSVMATGIGALGQTKSSQLTAKANIKAAEKQAAAAKQAGIFGAIGAIGGAGLSGLFSGGGTAALPKGASEWVNIDGTNYGANSMGRIIT